MEGQLWKIIESLLPDSQPPTRRFRYTVRDILRVALWGILHDRPICWACRLENWPGPQRSACLPHPSTISRRWRGDDLQHELRRLHEQVITRLGVHGRYGALDGRSLLVGGCSKDRDARAGRAVGGMGRGYKLHALVDAGRVIVCYEIEPLCVAEPTVAARLLRRAPREITRIVADTAYDSMNLHRVAAEHRRRLYTPLRQNRVGRRQQARRLRLLRLWQRRVGQRFLAWRDEIERTFGQTSTISFGFKGLPSWARRHHRVCRWMWGKILLHHAWLLRKRSAA